MLRKSMVLAIFVLFVGAGVVSAFNFNLVNESKPMNRNIWLYVGGSGFGNYSSIQDAIDNVSDGDTVFVYDDSSPYYENIIVNKTINLLGEDKNTTVIDGNRSGSSAYISADGVLVSGFTLIKSKWGNYSGIEIKSNFNNISGNIISNNYIGISLNDSIINTIFCNNISDNWVGIIIFTSSNNIISENIIESNGDKNIIIDSSNYNTIYGNNISGSYNGIFLNSSNNNTISNNNIFQNGRGLQFNSSSNNTITSNNILQSYTNIRLDSSSKNILSNNNISASEDGINLHSSSNNTISVNNIWQCYIGIRLDSSCKNTISNNTIFNSKRGIYLDSSKSNNVTGNNINLNVFGIFLFNSSSNNILQNNFLNNIKNAFFTKSTGSNWNGNYWNRPRLFPKPIFGIMKIGFKPSAEILAERRNDRLDLFKHPFIQQLVFCPVFLDLVKDRGLQVGYDKTLQKLEYPALYHLDPAKAGGSLLELAEEKGDDHFMRLLVEFNQFHRPHLVIPPLHICGIEYLQDQRLSYHHNSLNIYPVTCNMDCRILTRYSRPWQKMLPVKHWKNEE